MLSLLSRRHHQICPLPAFFPEERPEELIPHLRRHWGR
jgi:hypothetical protein